MDSSTPSLLKTTARTPRDRRAAVGPLFVIALISLAAALSSRRLLEGPPSLPSPNVT